MTDNNSTNDSIIRTSKLKCNGSVTAELVNKERMGIDAIVSSAKVQQAKNQIPKEKGTQQ